MDKIEKLTTENNELKVSLDKLKIKEMQIASDNNLKDIKDNIHKFKDIKDNEEKRRKVSIIFKKHFFVNNIFVTKYDVNFCAFILGMEHQCIKINKQFYLHLDKTNK